MPSRTPIPAVCPVFYTKPARKGRPERGVRKYKTAQNGRLYGRETRIKAPKGAQNGRLYGRETRIKRRKGRKTAAYTGAKRPQRAVWGGRGQVRSAQRCAKGRRKHAKKCPKHAQKGRKLYKKRTNFVVFYIVRGTPRTHRRCKTNRRKV